MKILLVKPYDPYGEGYYNSFGIRMPPLGLAELAGGLREAGHDVRIYDRMIHKSKPEEFAKRLISYDAVGFTTIATSYYPDAADVVRAIKETDKDVITFAGGHHATFMYPLVLRDGFDYVVRGEGEVTTVELMDSIAKGRSASSVSGIAYLDRGQIRLTPPRPPLMNLDESPMPAWDLIEQESYRADVLERGAKFATIETARGCPYNCDFCSVTAMWGHSWRMKSEDRILREIEALKDMGYKYMFFVDDDLVIPGSEESRKSLFKRMSLEAPDIRWFAQIRADLVVRRPDIMEAAAKAGMILAFIGIESGDDKTLREMKKGITTSMSARAVELLHRLGVIVFGGMILGAPYETWDSLKRSVKFSMELAKRGLDAIQFTLYTPLPGSTGFYRLLKDNKIITFDWYLYDCLHPLIRGAINPLRVYLVSRLANYAFYVERYLFSKAGKVIRGAGNPYASIMGRYVMSRLPLQVLYALKIPYDLLGVARKIARPKLLGNEEISTIIRAGLEPVFQVRPPLPTAQAMLKRRQFSNLDPYWNTSGQRYP
ncbi:MAG: B12-binding domain-containing radical SAM protein [Thermoprotei archaeon]